MKKKSLLCAILLGAAVGMAGCAAGGLSNEYITIAKFDGVEVQR